MERVEVFVPDRPFAHQEHGFVDWPATLTTNNPFKDLSPTRLGMDLAAAFGVDAHMSKSQRSFDQAIEEGRQNFAKAAPFFGSRPGFYHIPILKARQDGILPLPM